MSYKDLDEVEIAFAKWAKTVGYTLRECRDVWEGNLSALCTLIDYWEGFEAGYKAKAGKGSPVTTQGREGGEAAG